MLSVRLLMHIYQGVLLSWRLNADVLVIGVDGQLSAVRFCAVMAMVSGTWSSLTGLPDEPDTRKPVGEMPAERERRRYTLALQDDRGSERFETLLAGVSSRLRGELLRNLIITGLALHTTAPELPRLLASLPVPPATVSELQAIVRQMVRAEPGGGGISEAGETENAVSPVTTSPGMETAGIKKKHATSIRRLKHVRY